MRYAIVGTGAIGGYYGGMLSRAGHDVSFLLRSDYDHVRAHGLLIKSCNGDFTLPRVKAFRSTDDIGPVDVVLVCIKTTGNHQLATLLPPLLHKDTLILLIQNGIGPEPDLQAIFPSANIAAGLAFICSAHKSAGVINHQAYGHINIGNYSCTDNTLISSVIDNMCDAGIKAVSVDYKEARWKKAVWNMPFNGMTVVLDTTTDRLLACRSTRSLIREMMLEVVGAARALGIDSLDETFADKMIADTIAMPPYLPSMKLDFDNRRPMEIDYLYTRPIAEARKAGFDMPRLAMLEAQLRFLQSQHTL